MRIVSSKIAAVLGLLLVLFVLLLVALRSDSGESGAVPPHPLRLVRTMRWEGPWYYRVAKRTHTMQLIPSRVLNKHRLAQQISMTNATATLALRKLGTNAWPAVPALVHTVAHGDIYVGLSAAETLADIRAEESPGWSKSRGELRGQKGAAKTFQYLVMGRDCTGRPYGVGYRRFGLIGLAATGPAAGGAYSDIVYTFKHDKELALRVCAAPALADLTTEKKAAVTLLKAVLQDTEEWPQVSASAARALAAAAPGDVETRNALRRAMHDKRSAVRVAAARALWGMKMPAQEVLPVLTPLLHHKLVSTRTEALNGLAELGRAAQPTVSEIRPLASDDNEAVRHAAAEALKSIAGTRDPDPG